MIISPAFAQASGGAGGLSSLLPFLLIFVVFYFFLIRPQQKRAKEHREMVNNVKRGDKIVTSGGLLGTVSKSVEGQETVEVEIAKDIRVSVMRTMMTHSNMSRTTHRDICDSTFSSQTSTHCVQHIIECW